MINQMTMKQGIVAVLGLDSTCNEPAASIRRTLSADVSSKNQNGFPKYSEEFHPDDVWRSIQKNPKTESWDSMLSRSYVKRSLSGLNDESLDICTELLGSESGSDCFPSPDCSTECLSEGYKVKEQGKLSGRVPKFKTFPVRPLPPPLPSISQLHMQSRRENGRLIVDAVSVSPGNYFEARRGGGRLVLIFVRGGVAESERAEEVFGEMEDVPVVDMKSSLTNAVVDMKSSLTNAKIGVCNKGIVFVANKKEIPILKSLSLPPMLARMIPHPPVVASSATSFNAFEYFWRNKITENEDSDKKKKKKKNIENENMVMVKGNKGEDLVPYSRGCMVPRKSLLFWEPYCVATK